MDLGLLYKLKRQPGRTRTFLEKPRVPAELQGASLVSKMDAALAELPEKLLQKSQNRHLGVVLCDALTLKRNEALFGRARGAIIHPVAEGLNERIIIERRRGPRLAIRPLAGIP